MKIGYIASGLYPDYTGGMEIFDSHTIRELSKKMAVVVFSPCNPSFAGVEWQHVDNRPFFGKSFRMGTMLFAVLTCLRILSKSEKCDVYHISVTSNCKVYSLVFPFFFAAIRRRYIIMVHGGGMAEWNPRWMYRFLYDKAASVVAVSKTMQERLSERYSKEVYHVLPLIPYKESDIRKIDAKRMLGLSDYTTVSLYLGSLKPLKNPELLVNAIAKIPPAKLESGRMVFLLVGNGPSKIELVSLVKKHSLCSWVRFEGLVSHDLVYLYYVAADIYVIPSRFEGTSLSMIDAVNYRVPIIGANSPGIHNVIRHNETGLLCDPDDPDELARHLQFLVEHPDSRQQLASNACLEIAPRYDYAKNLDRLISIYEHCTKGGANESNHVS